MTTWLTLVSSLLFLVVARAIVARVLGPVAVGMYALMLTVATLGGTLLSLGLPAYNASFADRQPPALLLSNSIAWNAAALMALSLVCAPVLLLGKLSPPSQFIVLGLWMAPLIALLDCSRGILQGSNSIRAYNWVAFSGGALNFVCIALLTKASGLSLAGVALSWVSSVAISLGLAVKLVLHRIRLPRPDLELMKNSLKFGGQAWMSQMTGIVNFRIALVLIEIFLGTAAVGLYSVAAGIAELLFYFPNAVAVVTIARYGSSSPEEAAGLLARSCLFVLSVNACCAVALALIARPLILGVFGPQYERSLDVLLVLLPGVVIYSPVAVTVWYVNAHLRKPAINLLVAGSSALTGTLLMVMWATPHGLVGVAAAATCGYVAASLLNVVLFRRLSELSFTGMMNAAGILPRAWRRVDAVDSALPVSRDPLSRP
jgi:O-antigen/teichoic acid export membrane protein